MNESMQLQLNIRLRDDATLKTYVGDVGERLVGAANFVYLWGAPGCGKSHLLQAACHEARARAMQSIYLADLSHHSPEVLRDLERLSLVCLDDIDDVLPHDEWETALFHLVNAMRDSGAKLIVAAALPAARLPASLPDLKSRLLAASAIEASEPDDVQKRQILKEKAERQGLELTDEVCSFIMSRSSRDVRTLMDLLVKLEVETLRRQKKATIPFVKQVLGL